MKSGRICQVSALICLLRRLFPPRLWWWHSSPQLLRNPHREMLQSERKSHTDLYQRRVYKTNVTHFMLFTVNLRHQMGEPYCWAPPTSWLSQLSIKTVKSGQQLAWFCQKANKTSVPVALKLPAKYCTNNMLWWFDRVTSCAVIGQQQWHPVAMCFQTDGGGSIHRVVSLQESEPISRKYFKTRQEVAVKSTALATVWIGTSLSSQFLAFPIRKTTTKVKQWNHLLTVCIIIWVWDGDL